MFLLASKLFRLSRLDAPQKFNMVYVQKLNPILGENTWEYRSPLYDYHGEIAQSSYADMLHDTERNEKYRDALKHAIDKMHARGKKAKVLDIGTGTGLLSMYAANCGADSVVACEAFEPMSECAKRIVSVNGFAEKIRVLNKHSRHLTVGVGGDLSERANILVTEVFDTKLIGEGALMTFAHARRALLEHDCIVIPSAAIVYAQVVESPFALNWNTLRDIRDADGQVLVQTPTKIKNCAGAPMGYDIQLSQLPTGYFKEITAPKPVLTLDWMTQNFEDQHITKVKAVQDGKAQVVFMWWDLVMDTDDKIVLSCAPYWAHPLKQTNPNISSTDIPWRNHWMQALYYLPQQIRVQKDQELSLITCSDSNSFWFHIDSNPKSVSELPRPLCGCGLHCSLSRSFIGQINDTSKNKTYLTVLQKHIKNDCVVLCTSDGFYLGLAAAKFGAKQVLFLDDNYYSSYVLKQLIKHNNLNNVEVLEKVEDLQTNENIKSVNLVLGLPHFVNTLLPWDGLHFAYLVKKIRHLLPKGVVVAPKVFSLKAIIVEFKDLHRIRTLVETCGEFDMKPFDDMLVAARSEYYKEVESQLLWQYLCVARSPVVELARLNLETMFSSSNIKTEKYLPLPGPTIKYNAIVLWADWDLEGNGENAISTGPVVEPVIGQRIEWDMHARQGVHFLFCKNKDRVYVATYFDLNKGEFKFVFC